MRWMLVSGVAALLAGGCNNDNSCGNGDLPAVSGFAMYMEAPDLPDGVYHWTVRSDGLTRTRDVTITHGDGICDCSPIQDPPGSVKEAELWIAMDKYGGQMSLIDNPVDARITLPSFVSVSITRGRDEIANFAFTPQYKPMSGDCQTVMRSEYTVGISTPATLH